MKNLFVLIALALTLPVPEVEAAEFVCHPKVIVEHRPGPHWAELENHISKHLEFIAEQFKSGAMDFGGPLVDENQEPIGGFSVYNGSLKSVEELAANDPLVKEGVSVFTAKTWIQCVIQ